MVQKKAAKKTKKTTRQGTLTRVAKASKKATKKARRVPAPRSKSVPELLATKPKRGESEPVKRLARSSNVPAGTLVEELTDADHNAL